MMQKDIMLQGEGDAWFRRNRDNLGQSDPVSEEIEKLGIKPKSILEVGCSNGWRLAKLRDKYGAVVYGVDPSLAAGMDASNLRVPVFQTTASCMPVINGGFDLIIYGFCLYLTDPKDWLTIAAEGDRALNSGGHLIIHDFADSGPYAKHYEHRQGMLSYHYDFARLWAGHPFYTAVSRYTVDRDWVTIMKKSTDTIPVWP